MNPFKSKVRRPKPVRSKCPQCLAWVLLMPAVGDRTAFRLDCRKCGYGVWVRRKR